jgi:hypothetical protein
MGRLADEYELRSPFCQLAFLNLWDRFSWQEASASTLFSLSTAVFFFARLYMIATAISSILVAVLTIQTAELMDLGWTFVFLYPRNFCFGV